MHGSAEELHQSGDSDRRASKEHKHKHKEHKRKHKHHKAERHSTHKDVGSEPEDGEILASGSASPACPDTSLHPGQHTKPSSKSDFKVDGRAGPWSQQDVSLNPRCAHQHLLAFSCRH